MRLLSLLVASLALLVSPLFAGVPEDNAKLPDYTAFQALLKTKRNLTWVITGDSITHGALHTNGGRDYAEHFNERVRWEMGRIHDVWINTGVSGEKADGLLAAFDFRVARFKPDFVSINLGMNDCKGGEKNLANFRAKMTEMVKKIRALGAVPVIQVPNTIHAGDPLVAPLAEYSKVIREIAAHEKVLLVDHKVDWEKKAGGENKAPAAWLNNAIHPNALGHIEMAKTMFRDLGIFDPKSAVCRLGEHD